MSTRSFAPPVEEPSKAIVPAAHAVVTQNHYANASIEGEIDARDIKLPRFNLVQKSGQLNNDFTPGSILFNKNILLSDGTTPIEFTALKLRKQYQQSLPFDPNGPMPKVFDLAEEVLANGGHFCYDERKDGNYYKPMGHLMILVECPAGASPDERDMFIYEFGGKDYALAMWTVTGGSWTVVAKTIITAATQHLKDGLHHGRWTLKTEKRTEGALEWHAFILKATGKHTPEFTAFAESLLT